MKKIVVIFIILFSGCNAWNKNSDFKDTKSEKTRFANSQHMGKNVSDEEWSAFKVTKHDVKSKISASQILQGKEDITVSYLDIFNDRSLLYSGDQGGFFPKSPVIHDYDPFSSDILLNIKLPANSLIKMPQEVQDFFTKHSLPSPEIFIQTLPRSNLGMSKPNQSALKPHYWVDKDVPESFQGTRFQKNLLFGLLPTVYNVEQWEIPVGELKSFATIIHDGVASPDNGYLYIPDSPFSFFSVVVNDDQSKAESALTLHWVLTDVQQSALSSLLEKNKEISLQQIFYDEMIHSDVFKDDKTVIYIRALLN